MLDAAADGGGAEEAAGVVGGGFFVFTAVGFKVGFGGVAEGFAGIGLAEALVLGVVERLVGGVGVIV